MRAETRYEMLLFLCWMRAFARFWLTLGLKGCPYGWWKWRAQVARFDALEERFLHVTQRWGRQKTAEENTDD